MGFRFSLALSAVFCYLRVYVHHGTGDRKKAQRTVDFLGIHTALPSAIDEMATIWPACALSVQYGSGPGANEPQPGTGSIPRPCVAVNRSATVPAEGNEILSIVALLKNFTVRKRKHFAPPFFIGVGLLYDAVLLRNGGPK